MSATGHYLTCVREERGLSKYAVAAATGVSHGNLFKVEHGERFPTTDIIRRLGGLYVFTSDEVRRLLDCIGSDLTGPYRDTLIGGAS